MNGSCQKCGGLLVVERVLDYYGPVAGLKCVNCGWYRRDTQPSISAAGGSANRSARK